VGGRPWCYPIVFGRNGSDDRAGDGEEPDYRFSMANERTFLAWVRTALALLAAAVALAQLVPDVHADLRRVLGALLTALALVISGAAYPRWAANQRAMRHGDPLPQPRLLPVVGLVLVLIGVGVFILVVSA
jgi:putative membrane protein